MGELAGALPGGAGPPPVLPRAHTHLCSLQEEENGGRGGGEEWQGAGLQGLGLSWDWSSRFCVSPSPPKSAWILLRPPTLD